MTGLEINKHEAFLIMACIELKQEQILRLLQETPSDRTGTMEGLNEEYRELQSIHERIKAAAEKKP